MDAMFDYIRSHTIDTMPFRFALRSVLCEEENSIEGNSASMQLSSLGSIDRADDPNAAVCMHTSRANSLRTIWTYPTLIVHRTPHPKQIFRV